MDNQLDNKGTNSIMKKRAVLIVVAVIFVIGVLVYLGVSIKIPSNPLNILQKKAAVQLKTEYKNPFAKKTQFVNPFDKYKNPFVVNR